MMMRCMAFFTFLIPCVIVLSLMGFPQGSAAQAITVQPGFTCEVVATLPKSPTCLVLAPERSSFGPAIYVGTNPGFERGPDVIYKITPEGTVSQFAKLDMESDPVDLEFPPSGSPYGDFLYVSANNLDRRWGGDYGGTILRISPDAKVEEFTPVGLQPQGKPLGLGEPAGIQFGPGGAFGTSLYVANSSDPPADIARVDASGTVEIFLSDEKTGYYKGLGPLDLEFGSGEPFTSSLYFTDYPTSSVRTVDAGGAVSPPWVSPPAFRKRVHPWALKFSPGGAFGKDLYVIMDRSIYRVGPNSRYALFATGFGLLSGECMRFSPSGDALYVTDHVARKLFKISPAAKEAEIETITIRGEVTDQYDKTVEGVHVCFMGQPWAATDENGIYELTYTRFVDQEAMPVKVLLADSERPIRYETELREVSLESGENIINLQIKRVPSEIIVGGLKFQYQDLELSKYLDEGEKYRVGEYFGGDVVSYKYFGLGAVRHQYFYKNPGLHCASMNLSYKGKSYAPVRIYKALEEKQEDGTTEANEETLGHLFIDRQGNVIGGDDALEILYVIHLGMHTLGTPTKARLGEEISFYKSLRGVVQNMASKFDRMIKAGLALKGLETAVSVYLDLTVSGDWTGAAITTASSAMFFKQIIDRTDPDNIHKPQTLEDASKAVEAVKLTKTWYDGAQLVGKLDDLKSLKGPHSAIAMKRLFPAWDAMDPTELEKQLESAKLETSDKKDILGLAYDTFQLVEQSDEHTQKAVAWKIQAVGLIAMLSEIIEVLEGIQDGMATAAEAENVMTLKYLCSNMTMGYALLLEDVIKTNEFRKHWTFSGNIYRGLRGTAEKLGVVSEHSTEGAEQLIAAFKGDGTEQNPGMAYYQMQGYYLDTALASYSTKWTLERVKKKQTQTE